MRVGLLTTSYPRRHDDIAGRFVAGFAQALAARGHRIEVLAPEPCERVAPPNSGVIKVRWIPYVRPRCLAKTFYGAGVPDNLRRHPWAALGVPPYCAILAAEIARASKGWDCVVSHWALPSAAIASALPVPRPHLAVFHSADLHLLSKLPLRSLLAARLARACDALCFVAEGHRTRFLSMLQPGLRAGVQERCHVQPMGVEPCPGSPEPRAALRARLGLHSFTVLSVARLVPIKGLDVGIRAIAGRTDLEWVIVGNGPEQPRLEQLALHLRAPVRFVGPLFGAAKHQWLHAADLFLCPSRTLDSGRSEGLPQATLEAMRCGLPLVASQSGGMGSTFTHSSNALLIPEAQPDQLRRVLDRALADASLRRRLAQRGQALAMRHTWPAVAPRLEALLRTGSEPCGCQAGGASGNAGLRPCD